VRSRLTGAARLVAGPQALAAPVHPSNAAFAVSSVPTARHACHVTVLRRARGGIAAPRHHDHLPPLRRPPVWPRARAVGATPPERRHQHGAGPRPPSAWQNPVHQSAHAPARRRPGRTPCTNSRWGACPRGDAVGAVRRAWQNPVHQSAHAPRASPVCQHPMHQFAAPPTLPLPPAPPPAWQNPLHQSAHTPRASPACQHPMHQFPRGSEWAGRQRMGRMDVLRGATGSAGWFRPGAGRGRRQGTTREPDPREPVRRGVGEILLQPMLRQIFCVGCIFLHPGPSTRFRRA